MILWSIFRFSYHNLVLVIMLIRNKFLFCLVCNSLDVLWSRTIFLNLQWLLFVIISRCWEISLIVKANEKISGLQWRSIRNLKQSRTNVNLSFAKKSQNIRFRCSMKRTFPSLVDSKGITPMIKEDPFMIEKLSNHFIFKKFKY